MACAACLDRITKRRRFIFDYKSTEDASPDTFGRQIVRMGYHIQEAFYRRVVRNLGDRPAIRVPRAVVRAAL
jgi:hypothetical protein